MTESIYIYFLETGGHYRSKSQGAVLKNKDKLNTFRSKSIKMCLSPEALFLIDSKELDAKEENGVIVIAMSGIDSLSPRKVSNCGVSFMPKTDVELKKKYYGEYSEEKLYFELF